jgi:hypothetical protein
MTRDKDFKARVRARMRSTGEPYTAARSALLATTPATDLRRSEAERQQQLLVDRWFVDGRLRGIPARRKVRAAAMLEILTQFVPGQTYSEYEVSRILEGVHEDFASLRRELVSLGYLVRRDGRYWVCVIAPIRSDHERRELPVWEEIWLPEFACRATHRSTMEAS